MMICKFVQSYIIKIPLKVHCQDQKTKKKMNFLLIYNHRDGIHGNLLLLIFIHI